MRLILIIKSKSVTLLTNLEINNDLTQFLNALIFIIAQSYAPTIEEPISMVTLPLQGAAYSTMTSLGACQFVSVFPS